MIDKNRGILFKAKSYDTKKWVTGFYVKCLFGDFILPAKLDSFGFNGRFSVWVQIDIKTLCQYIGLKDSKFKNIFENDKVKLSNTGEDDDVAFIKYFSSSYYPAFDLDPSVDTDCNGLAYYLTSGENSIEVIGNKFDDGQVVNNE